MRPRLDPESWDNGTRVYHVVCDNGHRGTIDADETDRDPFAFIYVCPVCGARNPRYCNPPTDKVGEA